MICMLCERDREAGIAHVAKPEGVGFVCASCEADRALGAAVRAMMVRPGVDLWLRQTYDGYYAVSEVDQWDGDVIGRGDTPEEALRTAGLMK